MTTFTPEARQKLEHYLATHDLPEGVGTEESACSLAAINLAMTGVLTDDIPDCMSRVLGKAVISLQDAMPDEIRNSERYKQWLPNAAGTGRDLEDERLAVLLDWMWGTVLPKLQPLADKKGFGSEWSEMCEKRTFVAARAAARAAADALAFTLADAAADAAAYGAHAAHAADAADSAAYAATTYAAYATYAAAYASDADPSMFWRDIDPIGVLERMTFLGENQ